VTTSKDTVDQNRQIKTCDSCRKDTQSAILAHAIQFIPGGYKIIAKSVKITLKGLQHALQEIDLTFDDAKTYHFAELALTKNMCYRPALLCCRCFFPIFHHLQVMYLTEFTNNANAAEIGVFEIMQIYLNKLSTGRFVTDQPASLLMPIHQIMQYLYQFQIVDKDIPLPIAHSALSILDIQQTVPIMSIWNTHLSIDPPHSVKVIITSAEYVYFCVTDDTTATSTTGQAATNGTEHQGDNRDNNEYMEVEDHPIYNENRANIDKHATAFETAKRRINYEHGRAKKEVKTSFFVGRPVRKSFVGSTHNGLIVYYEDIFYRINYDDGDFA
jgi:hypothetical protein